MPLSPLKNLDDLLRQRFSSALSPEFGNLVSWPRFYNFCGRLSFNKFYARKLARFWHNAGFVEIQKRGLVVITRKRERPLEVRP